uniref:F-box domain-containing protein n=1 Tax=Ananas comosus var. bracteatus TaxID=296719 RepID=A0A6V7Q8Q0_ANACO|nr:unnamed protein product [Ananas comosus var. bracteatus]
MDRISALDDKLLGAIVSLLPLKEMLRTSVLSRRWRRVWTAARAFDFTGAEVDCFDVDVYISVYISRIDSCLDQLSASSSCKDIPFIRFPGIQDPQAADRWIRFATDHNVATLVFDLRIGRPCPVIERLTVEFPDDDRDHLLPASALRSCPLLSTISLTDCTVPREPPSAGPPAFPSLRAARLENVRVAAPQSLLDSCPVIAELTIQSPPEGFAFRLDRRHTVSTLRIIGRNFPRLSLPSLSPSLRTLALCDLKITNPPALIQAFQGLEVLLLKRVGIEPGADSGIQVRAQRMRHLMVQDSKGLGLVAVADTPQLCRLFCWGDIRHLRVFRCAVPKLEEAFLHCMVKNPYGGKYYLWKNLMQPLSHVRLLSANWWFICEFMQGCPVGSEKLIFDKLKEFHWWPVFKKYAVDPFGQWYTKRLSPIVVLSLLHFLECCPNVQHLCVLSTYAIPESPPPVVPSAEENVDEFFIKMENDFDLNQIEGLRIVQRVSDIGQSSLPQLKKFTVYQFSGGPGDMCLLRFVGLRCRDLQHIRLHCVKGSRGATPSIQSSVRRYFSTRSPHAILQFSECSSVKTCPRHAELRM